MIQNQSENINELAAALSKCQSEMRPAIKDSVNPYFKSKFADLNSIWDSCRDPLTKHGLSVTQTMEECGDKFNLITTLMHSSGQWIKSYFPILVQKHDAQSYGSACSYARRYSLSSIVGCTTGELDDDGEKAGREELINPVQVNELTVAFSKCEQDFVVKIWKTLKKEGIDRYDKITTPLYERLMKAAVNNIREFEGKNKKAPADE